MFDVIQSDTFRKWLGSLKDKQARMHIHTRLDRIKDGNLGDMKPVGEGVSEARLHYGPGYRLYFMQRGKTMIIMLGGGDKSSQDRDIKRAKKIASDWRRL